MKKKKLRYFFAVLFSFFVYSSFGQSLDCAKFRNGRFKITDANAGGVFVLDRRGDYQVENNQSLKQTLKFKVTWLDDCTYTLKLDKVLRNENNLPIPGNMIVTVKITSTTANSYTQESSSNLYTAIYKSEVVKIQ
jgi:hypothetical protein